jgi:hypothetical protein
MPWFPFAKRQRDKESEKRPSRPDTATLNLRHVLFGGGNFDVSSEHYNKKGWDIFELGQKSFWAVPDAIDWDAELVEDPKYADAIAAMLSFLCPGEKAAVTGASLISNMVKSEEAKFYFVEQAFEEAKHFDALRRIIPMINGDPLAPPSASVRLLYSYGVIDPNDVAFMMGSINVIGEHLANQIFHRINHVATSPQLKELIALIGKDESRHVAAGKRFFPEVFDEFKKNRHQILVKNVGTTIILAIAGADLVQPMKTLDIDLAEIMDAMYQNYESVTGGLPAFPDQAMFETILEVIRKTTPASIRTIQHMTDENGRFDLSRFLGACEHVVRSPRALRQLFSV